MLRFVVTGAPGAGKTTLLEALREQGYAVVGEAATDVISRRQAAGVDAPWERDDFIDEVVGLQRVRELLPVAPEARVQLFDRSPLCTLALARYQERAVTRSLADEVDRVVRHRLYHPTVLLVRPLGFIEPTAARRISYREALRFQATHEAVYREHGFVLLDVPAAPLEERVHLVRDCIGAPCV